MAAIVDLTIDSSTYKSYVALDAAQQYLQAEPALSATWEALTDQQRIQYLISATRHIDVVFVFVGQPTDGAVQETAWPRTGATYYDGTAIPDGDIPAAIVNATALLAGLFAGGVINTTAGTGTASVASGSLSSVKAGTVQVEYQSGTQTSTATPAEGVRDSIDDAIGDTLDRLGLLSRSRDIIGLGVGAAYGTDECAEVSNKLFGVSVY